MRRGLFVLGAGAVVGILALSQTLAPRRAALLGTGQVFDSNVLVQWDSHGPSHASHAGSQGTSGLSRYFKSAGADLARLPEARTFQLVEVPPSSVRHQQQLHSQDWDEAKWGSAHRRNVGLGVVDKDSAKGIWHSGGEHTEAWEGIDEVFPTDTPYAYEEDHVDKGESAKMKTFIGHVSNQLRLMEREIKSAGKGGAEMQRLTSVLEAGKLALAKIQAEMREKDALPQLRQVGFSAGGRARSGLRAHYLSGRSARNDIASYFDGVQSATEKENLDNTRATAESTAAPLPLHKLRAVPAPHGPTVEAFASEFASKLAEAMKEGTPASPSESDSCQLCVKIFGCMDCCEPVCKKQAPTTAGKEVQVPAKGGARGEESTRGATAKADASAKGFTKKAAEMMKVLDTVQRTVKKTLAASASVQARLHSLSRMPCECTSDDCRECPQSEARQYGGSASAVGSLSRMPCECTSDECKECPSGDSARQRYEGKLVRARRALREAEKAVAKTNDILVERVAALDATNQMAIKQGLGAYGPESDQDVWPPREPTPGKSEQVASGASAVIKGLMKEVGLAQQKAQALRLRLEVAERAAQHGAEVTAEQRHLIRELSEQLDEQQQTADKIDRVYHGAGLRRFGGERAEKLATRSVLPFYEQPGEGGDAVRAAVKFYENHPNEVRADVGGHPILSRD